MNTPLLELQDVTVPFKNEGGLFHLSLKIERGEFVSLVGKTGTGKSTLLRLFSALSAPSSGHVFVAGEDIGPYNEAERRWLRRSMGIIPQDRSLLDDRTVLDNVMLPALIAELSFQEAKERAILALSKCGVYALSQVRPNNLSTGERQLVALARAVVNRPAVTLADEPVAHLDDHNTDILLTLLGDFANAGVTVVTASTRALGPAQTRSRVIDLTPYTQPGEH